METSLKEFNMDTNTFQNSLKEFVAEIERAYVKTQKTFSKEVQPTAKSLKTTSAVFKEKLD